MEEKEHIMQFFAYEHLPAHLQAVSNLARRYGMRAVPRLAASPK